MPELVVRPIKQQGFVDIVKQIRLTEEPEIKELPVSCLKVDTRYQRPLRQGKLREIVRAFNKVALGVLIVSQRSEDVFVVLDGQHRLEAAKKVGLSTVPCVVYRGLTLEQEAAIFALCNTARANPKRIEVFWAKYVAGEQMAREIKRIVEECGMELADSYSANQRNVIRAVAALERVYEAGGERLLRTVLEIIRTAWPEGEPESMTGWIISGLAMFLRSYPEANRARLIERLSSISPTRLLTDAAAIAEILGVHAAKAIMKKIVDLYNYKLPGRSRLPENRIGGKLSAD